MFQRGNDTLYNSRVLANPRRLFFFLEQPKAPLDHVNKRYKTLLLCSNEWSRASSPLTIKKPLTIKNLYNPRGAKTICTRCKIKTSAQDVKKEPYAQSQNLTSPGHGADCDGLGLGLDEPPGQFRASEYQSRRIGMHDCIYVATARRFATSEDRVGS